MSRARQAGDQCNRNGQEQRARGGHDQHRHGPDGIAGEPPGGSGQHDGDGEKQQRIAVGQPGHGGL
ncbi:hypothetical protein D3C87_1927660 [compost metagenome]